MLDGKIKKNPRPFIEALTHKDYQQCYRQNNTFVGIKSYQPSLFAKQQSQQKKRIHYFES